MTVYPEWMYLPPELWDDKEFKDWLRGAGVIKPEEFPECEGCRGFRGNECTYDTDDLTHCFQAEIEMPISRFIERKLREKNE